MTWTGVEHLAIALASLLVVLATIYYGVVLFRGQRTKAATELATTTIAQQDSTINAQGERIGLLERDNDHLRELKGQQDRLIDSQAARITYLENVVTARDLIEVQGKVIRAGFSYLDVPDEVLESAAAS